MRAMSAGKVSDPATADGMTTHHYQRERRRVNTSGRPVSRVDLAGATCSCDAPGGEPSARSVAGSAPAPAPPRPGSPEPLPRHRPRLDAEPQIHAHGLLHRGNHRGRLAVDFEQQAHLVELAPAVDLDEELVDGGAPAGGGFTAG